jgi:cytidine deaminase
MKPRPPTRAALLKAAARAARNAYAPYSHFHVGAAIISEDGRVFSGCNIENASYGLTICAERNAIAAAISAGVRRISAIAIVADGTTPAFPCGACRQVLAEFAPDDTPVHIGVLKRQAPPHTTRLGDLLPNAFRLKHPTATARKVPKANSVRPPQSSC